MTDINDDYSPHDEADEARAECPPEDYGQLPPLDLKQAQAAYEQVLREPHSPAVSRVLSALAMAIERIAGFEALPTREEWAVTENDSTPPSTETVGPFTAEGALRAAAKHGVQAWRRVKTADPVVVRPWEPISPDAPF